MLYNWLILSQHASWKLKWDSTLTKSLSKLNRRRKNSKLKKQLRSSSSQLKKIELIEKPGNCRFSSEKRRDH
jgi:hypothetical protein